jgi:hypothetical protein
MNLVVRELGLGARHVVPLELRHYKNGVEFIEFASVRLQVRTTWTLLCASDGCRDCLWAGRFDVYGNSVADKTPVSRFIG